jgi:hypothetical protein
MKGNKRVDVLGIGDSVLGVGSWVLGFGFSVKARAVQNG